MKRQTKTYYVLGQTATTGVAIRCDDRDIQEHEFGQMHLSDCNKLARTTRLATEAEALSWFPAGLKITSRDSRFNKPVNTFEELGRRFRRGRDTLNAY